MATRQPKEKSKVVVRKLPPAMTEETFKQALDHVCPGRYNWLSYYQGKVSMKKMVFSRAYINFLTTDDVFAFKSKFDGHVFVSNRGNQYKCAVEYAPFQKVPMPEPKKNPLEGTIDKDPDYLNFLQLLESGPEMLPSAAAQREAEERAGSTTDTLAAQAAAGATVSSRLMEYLVNKYADQGHLGGASKAKQGRREQVRENTGPAAAREAKGGRPRAGAADVDISSGADRKVLRRGEKGAAEAASRGRGAAGTEIKGRQQSAREVKAAAGHAGYGRAESNAADADLGPSGSGRPTRLSHGKAAAVKTPSEKPQRGSKPSTLASPDIAAAAAAAASAAVAAALQAESLSVAAAAEGATAVGGKGRAKGAGGAAAARGVAGGRPASGLAAGAGGGEPPLVERPPAGDTPKLLLVKGGHKKETQAVAGGGADSAAEAAPSHAAEVGAHTGKSFGSKGQSSSSTAAASGARKAPAKVPTSKPSAAAAAGTGSGEPTGRADAASPAAGNGCDRDAEDLSAAAAASAAASAAVAAAAAARGKKVRAGFQAYVPGALKARGGGGGAGAGGGEGQGRQGGQAG